MVITLYSLPSLRRWLGGATGCVDNSIHAPLVERMYVMFCCSVPEMISHKLRGSVDVVIVRMDPTSIVCCCCCCCCSCCCSCCSFESLRATSIPAAMLLIFSSVDSTVMLVSALP